MLRDPRDRVWPTTLTSSNGFYRITLDLSKDKRNPDGTFTTGTGSGPFNGQFDDGSGIVNFKGDAKNNVVSFTVAIPGGSASGTADILAGNSMSGSWSNTEKQKGQWSAATFGCS